MDTNITKHVYADNIGCVELIDSMGDDLRIVNAARATYERHKDLVEVEDVALIDNLIKSGHYGVTEHCAATFRFTVPLFVRSQHMRHRTWSYNEKSMRATKRSIRFFFPGLDKFRGEAQDRLGQGDDFKQDKALGLLTQMQNAALHSIGTYNNLIAAGLCKEQARMILPQNMYTTYYGTAKLRNIFEFLKQRLDVHAQYEIRVVAQAVLEFVEELFPLTTAAYRKYYL